MTAADPRVAIAGPRPLRVCDRATTEAALPFDALVDEIARACAEVEAGVLVSPERRVVPLGAGGGSLLSMPAVAPDLPVHKLVTVQPGNAARGLPTIHGALTVCDATTGEPLCLLDGPEVTGRRTAAVSMLAIRTFLAAPPTGVLLIGTGVQTVHHLKALRALWPEADVWVRGSDAAKAAAFCERQASPDAAPDVSPDAAPLRPCGLGEVPEAAQVVIALTTATRPVHDEPPRPDRLVIGVGAFRPEMAEIGKATLDSSDVYVDDLEGARHEAGDLLQAGIDWRRVRSLASALREAPDPLRPVVFKSVGTAAWDLAAARVAWRGLRSR